ncbi:unnamed protein product [Spirodela intermedia]|uniref:Uncharacterized protein n=1 Tax=Spirodela intermedia TaxID=51605 RepID=A0A7I8KLX7_SPIIN|nr:unnamed protein product [Spirodela intermedia]
MASTVSSARALSSSVEARRKFSRTTGADPCSSRNLAYHRRLPARIFCSECGARGFALSVRAAPAVGRSGWDSVGDREGLPREGEGDEEEAREALVQLLEECGASREDSLEIVSKCPKYLEMLMGNVKELDEHSLWGFWEELGEGGQDEAGRGEYVSELSFRKKVYLMAKKKGDRGVLPYFESIGLRYTSSVHISGYVSSISLLELIEKVKFVKEMLFSRSDHESQIGKNAQRMMMQLSITIDEDIQKTLSFFEKMEAKRGGLNMLGSKDTSLPCLVESFPQLLSCSVDKQLRPLIDVLEDVGVTRECVRDVLLLFPPLIFHDIEDDIKPRIDRLSQVGAEGKDVGKMLVKYPWILSTCIQENIGKVHSFLGAEKVGKASIDRAVRSWPHILGCSTSRMKIMVRQFGDLGVSSKMLGKIITTSPQLLLRRPDDFLKVVSFMEEVGFDHEIIGKILCRCPELFAADVEQTLTKKLGFLTELGISSAHLPRVIKKYPEVLLYDVDRALLPRTRFLMKAGLSKGQVGSMVFRFSPILGYSVGAVLRPKLEFLVNAMGRPLRDVVEYPRYFSYSLEKKIEPRFRLLRGRNVDCTLRDMLGKNDEEFAEDYLGIGRILLPPPPPPPPPSPSFLTHDDDDGDGVVASTQG